MLQQQQQHAQQQAAAAASVAQQQHYNRIAANHSSMGQSMNSGLGQESSMTVDTVSEENRRTLAFIADLLNEDTREAALLELSKKREQVPELALILWHSFGMHLTVLFTGNWVTLELTHTRCDDVLATGNYICLYSSQPVATYSSSLKSSL